MPAERLSDVAATGVRLDTLRALRDHLARSIDGTSVSPLAVRDLPPLARQLVEVLAQIDAVEKDQPQPKGTALDELTNRRATASARKTGTP